MPAKVMILRIQIRRSHADSKSYFYILSLAPRHSRLSRAASVFANPNKPCSLKWSSCPTEELFNHNERIHSTNDESGCSLTLKLYIYCSGQSWRRSSQGLHAVEKAGRGAWWGEGNQSSCCSQAVCSDPSPILEETSRKYPEQLSCCIIFVWALSSSSAIALLLCVLM